MMNSALPFLSKACALDGHQVAMLPVYWTCGVLLEGPSDKGKTWSHVFIPPNSIPLFSSPYSLSQPSFIPHFLLMDSLVGPAVCLPGGERERPPREWRSAGNERLRLSWGRQATALRAAPSAQEQNMQQILCRWWSLTRPLKVQDLGLGFIFEIWSLSW